ncbi:MAG: hypothetical protein KKH34_11515 [Candidatus Omnitrophica bacterium]|nr:hypothetical protein [Candidatus Omnitrophota bacterium]
MNAKLKDRIQRCRKDALCNAMKKGTRANQARKPRLYGENAKASIPEENNTRIKRRVSNKALAAGEELFCR